MLCVASTLAGRVTEGGMLNVCILCYEVTYTVTYVVTEGGMLNVCIQKRGLYDVLIILTLSDLPSKELD